MLPRSNRRNGGPYRQLPQLPGNPMSSQNYAWLLDSRNKKSLALDLAKPAGQAVLHTLVRQTDVFITNYPREVRRRLKLDYETLAPLNLVWSMPPLPATGKPARKQISLLSTRPPGGRAAA